MKNKFLLVEIKSNQGQHRRVAVKMPYNWSVLDCAHEVSGGHTVTDIYICDRWQDAVEGSKFWNDLFKKQSRFLADWEYSPYVTVLCVRSDE